MKQDPRFRTQLPALAGLGLLFLMMSQGRLLLDPWIDELFSLREFVLVSPVTTVSSYPVPNNHVFFNLCENVWLRLGSVQDLQQLLNHKAYARLFPFLCSLLVLWATYLFAYRRGGVTAGLLSAVLLLSSMPFLNYAAQLRGYGLSMGLFATLICAADAPRPRIPGVVVCSALMLYTLPSNFYLLIATAAGFLAVRLLAAESGLFGGKKVWRLALWTVAGITLGIVCYTPILGEVIHYGAQREGGPQTATLTRTLPVVIWHLLSGRWILLLPLLAIPFLKYPVPTASRGAEGTLLLFAGLVLLLPFLFSALRGDGAPDRVFLPVLPLLCMAWGLGLARVIAAIRKPVCLKAAIALCIAFCFSVTIYNQTRAARKAMDDRLAGTRCADLLFQYYLWDFKPQQTASDYAQGTDILPVINLCRMDTELAKYLQINGVRIVPPDSLAVFMAREDEICVVADYQLRASDFPGFQFHEISKTYAPPKLVLLQRQDPW